MFIETNWVLVLLERTALCQGTHVQNWKVPPFCWQVNVLSPKQPFVYFLMDDVGWILIFTNRDQNRREWKQAAQNSLNRFRFCPAPLAYRCIVDFVCFNHSLYRIIRLLRWCQLVLSTEKTVYTTYSVLTASFKSNVYCGSAIVVSRDTIDLGNLPATYENRHYNIIRWTVYNSHSVYSICCVSISAISSLCCDYPVWKQFTYKMWRFANMQIASISSHTLLEAMIWTPSW